MAWAYLVVAGFFECGWAIGLKYSAGFTKPVPSLLTVVAMGTSVWLLSLAMKTIPISTAYAVWTGIGAVGVAITGMLSLASYLSRPRPVHLHLSSASIWDAGSICGLGPATQRSGVC